MYSNRGRGGPSRATPTNVLCQKCLQRDMCPSLPAACTPPARNADTRRTPLFLRVQGCATGAALQAQAVSDAAATKSEADPKAGQRCP